MSIAAIRLGRENAIYRDGLDNLQRLRAIRDGLDGKGCRVTVAAISERTDGTTFTRGATAFVRCYAITEDDGSLTVRSIDDGSEVRRFAAGRYMLAPDEGL